MWETKKRRRPQLSDDGYLIVQLVDIAHARSGDKGDTANVGASGHRMRRRRVPNGRAGSRTASKDAQDDQDRKDDLSARI